MIDDELLQAIQQAAKNGVTRLDLSSKGLTSQQNHPTATPAEAEDIIEAEFTEIQIHQPHKWQIFRQELLNRDRWFNGGKAALSETAKHYVDNSVILKAGLAFLEGFSAEEG